MLKSLVTLLLLTAICFSNADAQFGPYVFVSSDLESDGTKLSTYTVQNSEDILVRLVHTPGITIPPLSYPLIFATRIRVYVNDVLQYSSGGNLSIINYWSCTLNNIQSSSVVKVQLDFALTVPTYQGNPPATIAVTSRILPGTNNYAYKNKNSDNEGNIRSPIYNLFQNYPNPFNPITTIEYNVQSPGWIKLDIYNSLGELVQSLTDAYKTSGSYSVNFNAEDLPSGVYFYTIRSDNYVQTRKMILLK